MISSCKDEKVVVLTTTTDVLNLKTLDDNQSFTINCSDAWTAKSSDSWCVVSEVTGTGNSQLKVNGKNNFTGYPRAATITITAGDKTKLVKVTQNGGELLFEENFIENSRNWIQEGDSLKESMSKGIFTIKNTNTLYYYFVGVKPLVSDYTGNYMITMKYNHITGNGPFGLVFARQDNLNYYIIYFYSDGYFGIREIKDGTNITIIGAPSKAVSFSNTICLKKQGSSCEVYVNDVLVNSFNLATPFGSYVSLASFPDSEIGVDYLRVIKQ